MLDAPSKCCAIMLRPLAWLMVAGCAVGIDRTHSMHVGCCKSFDGTLGLPGEGPPGACPTCLPEIWTTDEWGRQLAAWEPARPLEVDTPYGRQVLSALARARVPRWPAGGQWHMRSEADRLVHLRWIRVVLGQPDVQLEQTWLATNWTDRTSMDNLLHNVLSAIWTSLPPRLL